MEEADIYVQINRNVPNEMSIEFVQELRTALQNTLVLYGFRLNSSSSTDKHFGICFEQFGEAI